MRPAGEKRAGDATGKTGDVVRPQLAPTPAHTTSARPIRAGHSSLHDLRHQGGVVVFLVVSVDAALELSFMLPLVVDPLVIM